MLERFRAVRDEIDLRMKTWLEHPEVELARLRKQRERERRELRERLEAKRQGETTPVGGAGYEGYDPFRRV
jgi:arsenate reductase (thioredoxin)